MEKIIIDAITDANTGPFVVLGGVLAGMMLVMLIMHLSIRSRISNRIDERIINLMRSDSSAFRDFDRDDK